MKHILIFLAACGAPIEAPVTHNNTARSAASAAVTAADTPDTINFDGTTSVTTASGQPLHAAERVLLSFDPTYVARFLFTFPTASGTPGQLPDAPHLYIRTDSGHFHEVSVGLVSAIDPGWNYHSGSGAKVSVPFTIPANADRFEFFLRYERWTFDQWSYQAENLVMLNVTGIGSEDYVSNYGKNFQAPFGN